MLAPLAATAMASSSKLAYRMCRRSAQPSQGTDTISPTLGKYFLQSAGLAATVAGDLSTVLVGVTSAGVSRDDSLSLSERATCCSVVGFRLANTGIVSQSTAVGPSAASVFQTPSASYQRDVP